MEQLDIRILLVNHQELVRCGLQRLLNDAPQLRVVGEASGGEEAIQLSRSLKPDVVLMDVQMPGMGVVEITRRITGGDSNTRVLVVTLGGDDPFPARLLDAGASGYLTKNCGIAEISDAIRVVARGERYLSSDIARQMALSMLPGSPQSPFQRLSRRELQVMLMVAQGQSVHDISDQLCLSSKTISTYRYRLYEKLGVGNDVELAHLAIRHGFLDVGVEP
jgi:two-component system invasion response regulator UvrY